MSKYDNIKTAADLVAEVFAHGLSMAQEDCNRAADIFGNTNIEELARLANDIGRNNDKGEPDPKGSWNSNRRPTQSTFYMIAFSIWNWENATRFWNQHTNPEHEALQETKKSLKAQEEKTKELAAKLEKEQKARITIEEGYNRIAGRYSEAERQVEASEAAIMALKAKLYDYMSKEGQTA